MATITYTQHEETDRGYTAYNAILKGYTTDTDRCALAVEAQTTLGETLLANAMPNPDAVQAAEDESAMYRDRRNESFDRCDTDGFVSQYFDGVASNVSSRQATIERQGGQDVFCALFDLDGRRLNAELRDGQWGQYWLLKGNDRPASGKPFVTAFPARESTLRKKGYLEGYSTYPAKAITAGEGYGLSGRCWAASEKI